MIEFRNVSKDYPSGTHALNNISLKINDGEFVFIVGSSGAGKSTFLKLIMSEERLTKGEITVDGIKLKRLRRRKVPYLRRKMGIVFQDFRLIEKMSVYDNVAFAMRCVGASNKTIKERVPYILRLVGLGSKIKSKPSQLSGGEQQRVSLARALVNNPEIIIADEPTTALDVTIQAQVLELIQEMSRQTGAAVIMITHDLGVVASLCDRINIMYGGRLAETGTDREIFYEPNHPYTKGLLNCINNPEDDDKELTPIPGSPPDLLKPPAGCPFVDRCSEAMKICKTKMPVETIFSDTHRSACWLNEKKNREEAQHGNTK